MTPQYKKFRDILDELFMLDHAELDFGIYRIMNQKRADIAEYLDNRLQKQVEVELSKHSMSSDGGAKLELDKLITTLTSAGMNADDSPKVQELKAKLKNSIDPVIMEAEVYSHLATFFKRYFEGGDFMSMRRYKKDVYAIPYEGEEVKLHWANADQYYIKTSEYFQNYTFKADGRTVHFALRDATTEQNNNKAQGDKERRFKLCEEDFITEDNGELTMWFSYEPMPKSVKQPALMKDAITTLKEEIDVNWSASLFFPMPTEKNKTRTVLEKHLNDYVSRNSFDYFIHKDLGAFLRRELDFYIKNEVLFIDDISTQEPERFLGYLSQIKTIKSIGERLISFLAQLEDFQKKLWLKKKFVVESNYCITLDRVPTELYAEIAYNDNQREEWVRLFAIDQIECSGGDGLFGNNKIGYSSPLSIQFLEQNQFLVLDTAFFDDNFKHKLISSIDNFDEQLDGTLINSENFQALNLLQEKYRESVKCIYIDPPYNTGGDGFIYKDNYQHSSWLSMMNDRLNFAKNIMAIDSVMYASIDNNEVNNLTMLFNSIFGEENFITNISVVNNIAGRSDSKHIAKAHEYTIAYQKSEKYSSSGLDLSEKQLLEYKNNDNNGRYRLQGLRKRGSNSLRTDRPKMYYPVYYNTKTMEISLSCNNDDIVEIVPRLSNGVDGCWRWGKDTFLKKIDLLQIKLVSGRNEYDVYEKVYLDGEDGLKTTKLKSYLIDAKYTTDTATTELKSLLPNTLFNSPKPIGQIRDLLKVSKSEEEVVFDFFAGSGTTGHAVINLNREDKGKRKYMLVEMGTYFDTVTKPRIQKVIYSKDWKDGKPVSREGSSHCFKYVRLESYEDTLNNLTMQGKGLSLTQGSEFADGFMLGYMLDTEAKGSLFNTEWFVNPFDFRLKITRNNELIEQRIDLIETFNYLIGLNINSIQYPKAGLCVVEGVTRRGEKTLVIWRDCTKIANEELNKALRTLSYNTLDTEFDRINVNGDNTLQNTKRDDEHWKVTLIEQEFSARMFE